MADDTSCAAYKDLQRLRALGRALHAAIRTLEREADLGNDRLDVLAAADREWGHLTELDADAAHASVLTLDCVLRLERLLSVSVAMAAERCAELADRLARVEEWGSDHGRASARAARLARRLRDESS